MGISMAYHLCVAPDHDTFESSVLNSIETKRDGGELLKIGGVHVASSLAEPPPSALATATTVLAVEAGTAIEQEVGATPGAASLAEGFRLSSVVGRDSAEHTVVHGHDNGRPSKSSCSPSSDENAKAGQGIRNLAQGERDEEDEYAGVKGAEINSRRSPVSDGKDSRRGGIDASALQGLGEAAAVGESVSSVDDEEEDDGDDWGEVQVRADTALELRCISRWHICYSFRCREFGFARATRPPESSTLRPTHDVFGSLYRWRFLAFSAIVLRTSTRSMCFVCS